MHAIESGYEFERALEFADRRSFRSAIDDELLSLGGVVARAEFTRPTLILDTPDDAVVSTGCSLTVVMNAGRGVRGHKVVFKGPPDEASARYERILRIDDPSPGWMSTVDWGTFLGGTDLEGRLSITDLDSRAVVRQLRYKRTVVIEGTPVWLSFDDVTFHDGRSRVALGGRLILEAESSGTDKTSLARPETIDTALNHFRRFHSASPFRSSKGAIARAWQEPRAP